MDQTLCLRHANFKVHWTLTDAERPLRATWEGRGPAGSYARTSYRLTPNGDGTHFEYENEFKSARRFPRRPPPPEWWWEGFRSGRRSAHWNNSKHSSNTDRQRPMRGCSA